MSCQLCEDDPVETYVRVGDANVLIAGCIKHLNQLLEMYKAGLKASEKAKS